MLIGELRVLLDIITRGTEKMNQCIYFVTENKYMNDAWNLFDLLKYIFVMNICALWYCLNVYSQMLACF